mgnify:CR=1 FL=1
MAEILGHGKTKERDGESTSAGERKFEGVRNEGREGGRGW